ncbi:glycerate dehydrogenase, partial [bacterium]|nr:glycerate dehydrogenase [bacterium]
IFAQCHVVSLHAPNLPSTRGMIAGHHFASMQRDATFINTARGDIIREEELVAVLRQRPDLWAVLDVLADNDHGADPALYDLPNVVLTPHIAGALDGERRRMGAAMVAELRRYLAGQPLQWQITRERLEHMA